MSHQLKFERASNEKEARKEKRAKREIEREWDEGRRYREDSDTKWASLKNRKSGPFRCKNVNLQISCWDLKKKVNMQFLREDCIIAIKMLKRGIFDKYPKIFTDKCILLHVYHNKRT